MMKKLKIKTVFCLLMTYTIFVNVRAQCFNTDQFPSEDINASHFSTIVTTISDSIEAGQYCVVNN